MQGFNFFTTIVYVSLGQKDNATYVGMGLMLLPGKRTNAGKNRYTKAHLHWKIIYTEKHPDRAMQE